MNQTSAISVLAKSGKSFYFAGFFLPRNRLEIIAELYSFCRYVDDCADELSASAAKVAIENIKSVIRTPQIADPLQTKIMILEQNGVARDHMQALIRGAEWDIDQEPILSEEHLDQYCYHVAGVVGLMMNPLMAVFEPQSHPYAVQLGKAMQLTNICRDILEDAKNGRIYLPKSEIECDDINLELLKTEGPTPDGLKKHLKKYLAKAHNYYEAGQKGLPFIPLRCRFVILLASELYRSIGEKIIKNNYEVLYGRTYLTIPEKIGVFIKTIPKILRPQFWLKPKEQQQGPQQ